MYRKLLFLLSLVLFFSTSYGQSTIDQDNCNKIKNEIINLSDFDSAYLQQQIFKIIPCGFDTVDCSFARSLLSYLVVEKLNNHEEGIIKYGELIAVLSKMKNTSEYAEVRMEIIHPPKIVVKEAAFLSVPQYFDYEQAKELQKIAQKPLLIYFTAKHSLYSRKMEDEVLSETNILDSLNKFIIVTLYIDDDKMGKKNSKLQENKYKDFGQPQFIIEFPDGTWRSQTGYCSKEKFASFLAHYQPVIGNSNKK